MNDTCRHKCDVTTSFGCGSNRPIALRLSRSLCQTSILACAIAYVGIPLRADAITFDDVITQVKSDFDLFVTLQAQFVINYPVPGTYFQGIASPGVYNEPTQGSLIYIPVNGIPRDFNPLLKPDHRNQNWADFGFTGDSNGKVI